MAYNFAGNSASIGTTEFFLASNASIKSNQTDKVLVSAWVDCASMVAGDQYRIKLYEIVNGETQRSTELGIVTGAQAFPWVSPMLFLGEGWEFSVTKLAGTTQKIAWSLRKAGS